MADSAMSRLMIIHTTYFSVTMKYSIVQYPVVPEYSFGLWKIDMVNAVDGWEFNDVAGFRCVYGTTVRCVAIQRLVC
jgi:hypothetical protein